MEDMLMAAAANTCTNATLQQAATAGAGGAAGVQARGHQLQQPAAPAGGGAGAGGERRARPQKEKALNCPRCHSTHTKFCYYNNYSLTQPRYFCKTCRRYWTEGGSLRNVPVGGGSRKNKRSSSSSSAANINSSAVAKNPKITHEGAQDLNLSFTHHAGATISPPDFASAFPSLESSSLAPAPMAGVGPRISSTSAVPIPAMSAMDLLRSTGYYVPMHMAPVQLAPPEYAGAALFGAPAGLAFPAMEHPAGGFHHHGNVSYGGMHGGSVQDQSSAGSRLLFPFEELKPAANSGSGGNADQLEAGKAQQANEAAPGFWSGMIGGSGGAAGGSWP